MAQQTGLGTIAPSHLTLVGTGDTAGQTAHAQPRIARCRRPRPTPHLTPDEYIRLLAFIEDQGGIVTIDDISRALPRVSRPVSAVFDLCDADILNLDWETAFDGDTRVWRVDR